jgi:glycosyltransferase involved in cell wall biosynthesis
LNIVGYTELPTGIGESARLCRQACEEAGIPSGLIDVNAANVAHEARYRATLFHVNADKIPHVHNRLREVFDASAYNIGLWHWELSQLPDEWVASAAPLDEIWTASTFTHAAVSKKVKIPVVHMAHGVEVREIEACSPEELGVPPGRFTFLCMFDLLSMTRKNPLGAVEAFLRAFPQGSSAALLIKVSHADRQPAAFAQLEERLRGIPNVYLTNKMLSRARVNGLLAACDGVVSLHRSEGFGLGLAEAMALGKPVVATAWSGNMDFMDDANSCPVEFDLVTLDAPHLPFGTGLQWAEPNLDHAAQLMRNLFDDPDSRKQIGESARYTMQSQFSANAAGRRYRDRLDHLGLLG